MNYKKVGIMRDKAYPIVTGFRIKTKVTYLPSTQSAKIIEIITNYLQMPDLRGTISAKVIEFTFSKNTKIPLDELPETLTKILYPYLKIKIISRRISEISPVWIKNKDIDLMFCYNGLEWLEYQMASMSIIENHLREVKLCIPKIVNGIIDSKDVTPELFIKHMGQQAGCVQLEYLDTAVFSADLLTYKRYNKLTEKKEDL
jgi:hypothetical protein